MSCQALKANLKQCRNWSCLESDFCTQHQSLSYEVFKKRWIQRYILGQQAAVQYSYWNQTAGKTILNDLETKRITLTSSDIAKIPSRDRYLDIYLFLIHHGYAKPSDNCELLARCYWYYVDKCSSAPARWPEFPLKTEIRDCLILSSAHALFRFLKSLAKLCKDRQRFTTFAVQEVPSYLDTNAAKELSWWSRDELDSLRIHYEKELGSEHPLTKCLLQRWLLDLKELYKTEKAIQKLKMEQCKEELMMNRWHPDRIWKLYEEFGLDIEDI